MKILLSAYACEPNRGSEQGVGWGWALEWAKENDVWVITRDRNQSRIEDYLKTHDEIKTDNLHFVYVGLPKSLTFWKKGNRGIRLYYMHWQRAAAKVAINLKSEIKFDYVQHVTFVSYTQPTYMYKLGIPLIWGPVSGGENIPKEIKIRMNPQEKITELIRKVSQFTAFLTPSIRNTMRKSKLILCTTEETLEKIPSKYRNKAYIMPAIGMSCLPEEARKPKQNHEKIRIVMAGRLIYWKAFDIGIEAYKRIADEFPNTELHILGEGNKKKKLKELAGEYLDKQIFFDAPVAHDSIYEYYSRFDLFLNTTLRDSGCMAMMEAMSVGLPCITIATGGPAILADCGYCVSIKPIENEKLINAIKNALAGIINGKDMSNCISGERLEFLTMHSRVLKLEEYLKQGKSRGGDSD